MGTTQRERTVVGKTQGTKLLQQATTLTAHLNGVLVSKGAFTQATPQTLEWSSGGDKGSKSQLPKLGESGCLGSDVELSFLTHPLSTHPQPRLSRFQKKIRVQTYLQATTEAVKTGEE